MEGRKPDSVTAITQQIQAGCLSRVDDEATIHPDVSPRAGDRAASWNWPFSRKDMEVYGQKGYAITVGRDAVRVRLPEKRGDIGRLEAIGENEGRFRFLICERCSGRSETGGTVFSRNECDCDGNTRRRETVRGHGQDRFPGGNAIKPLRCAFLFYGNGAVQRLADFLREHLRCKWFLEEGDSFLKRPILSDHLYV